MEEKKGLTWKAPEYVYYEKGSNWYLWSIIIAGALAVFAAFQKNLMFLALIVIAEITVILLANRKPQEIQIVVSEKGIRMIYKDSEKEYLYSDIKGFAIYHNPLGGEYSELILEANKTFSTHIKLLVLDEHVDTVKEVLERHLDEIEFEESLVDHIIKKVGF